MIAKGNMILKFKMNGNEWIVKESNIILRIVWIGD